MTTYIFEIRDPFGGPLGTVEYQAGTGLFKEGERLNFGNNPQWPFYIVVTRKKK